MNFMSPLGSWPFFYYLQFHQNQIVLKPNSSCYTSGGATIRVAALIHWTHTVVYRPPPLPLSIHRKNCILWTKYNALCEQTRGEDIRSSVYESRSPHSCRADTIMKAILPEIMEPVRAHAHKPKCRGMSVSVKIHLFLQCQGAAAAVYFCTYCITVIQNTQRSCNLM